MYVVPEVSATSLSRYAVPPKPLSISAPSRKMLYPLGAPPPAGGVHPRSTWSLAPFTGDAVKPDTGAVSVVNVAELELPDSTPFRVCVTSYRYVVFCARPPPKPSST